MLGIETSCDDTGVAVVSTSGRVLSEALASQVLVFSQLLYGLILVSPLVVLAEISAKQQILVVPGRRTCSIWRCGAQFGHGSSQSCHGQLC